MGKRKIIGGLLAALTSLSFSGGNFSSALKDEVRGTSKTKVMKNGKSLGKNKGGRQLGAIKGMSRKYAYARKIENNLNKNSGSDYSYKVIGYGAGGLVVAVVSVGGVYKAIKYFKNRGTEASPELIPINGDFGKVDDKDKSVDKGSKVEVNPDLTLINDDFGKVDDKDKSVDKGSKGDVELSEKSGGEQGKKKEHVEINKIKIVDGDDWIKELVKNGKVDLDKTKGYIAGNIEIKNDRVKNVDAYVSECLSDEVAWFAASILSGGRVHVSTEDRARKYGVKGTCPACNLYLKLGVDVPDGMLDKILVRNTSEKAKRSEACKDDKDDKYVKDGWMKFRLVNALEWVDKLGSAVKLDEGKCLLGFDKCIFGKDEFSFSLSDDVLVKGNLKSGEKSDGTKVKYGYVGSQVLLQKGWQTVGTGKIGDKRDMLRLVLKRVFYNITGNKIFAIYLAGFVAEKFVDPEDSLEK